MLSAGCRSSANRYPAAATTIGSSLWVNNGIPKAHAAGVNSSSPGRWAAGLCSWLLRRRQFVWAPALGSEPVTWMGTIREGGRCFPDSA